MPKNNKKKTAIARRRRQVAQLVKSKVNQSEIAEKLGCSQQTISTDIKALRQQWREEAATEVSDFIARELAELHSMERDCAVQFAATKDVKWIDTRLKIKTRVARMLGIDAPVRKEISGTIDVRQLSDAELRAIIES